MWVFRGMFPLVREKLLDGIGGSYLFQIFWVTVNKILLSTNSGKLQHSLEE